MTSYFVTVVTVFELDNEFLEEELFFEDEQLHVDERFVESVDSFSLSRDNDLTEQHGVSIGKERFLCRAGGKCRQNLVNNRRRAKPGIWALHLFGIAAERRAEIQSSRSRRKTRHGRLRRNRVKHHTSSRSKSNALQSKVWIWLKTCPAKQPLHLRSDLESRLIRLKPSFFFKTRFLLVLVCGKFL